jgi:hypothetical protein
MRRIHLLALVSVALAFAVVLDAQVPNVRPAWAYAIPPQPAPPPNPDEDSKLLRIPGAQRAFTSLQLRDPFGPRHPAERTARPDDRNDEARRRAADRGGHHQHRRVHGVPDAVTHPRDQNDTPARVIFERRRLT